MLALAGLATVMSMSPAMAESTIDGGIGFRHQNAGDCTLGAVPLFCEIVEFVQVDDPVTNIQAGCARGPGADIDSAGVRYIVGAFVAAKGAEGALGVSVTCRFFNGAGSWLGAASTGIGASTTFVGVSQTIPYEWLAGRVLCVRATALYLPDNFTEVYSTNAGCPTGWT